MDSIIETMDQEGPIENYQEFFDDILDEHRRFVSITRLPQFWFIEDDITGKKNERIFGSQFISPR